jgi:hypothetical protein
LTKKPGGIKQIYLNRRMLTGHYMARQRAVTFLRDKSMPTNAAEQKALFLFDGPNFYKNLKNSKISRGI